VCLAFIAMPTVLGQSKKLWLFRADEFYQEKDYASALMNYHLVLNDSLAKEYEVHPYETALTNQKLKKSDSTNFSGDTTANTEAYVKHQIAMCYRNTYDYSHAVAYFKESKEDNAYPVDHYYYANSLMKTGKYEDAITEYENYLKKGDVPDEFLIKTQEDLAGCHFALNPAHINLETKLWKADTSTFNKGTASFGAIYWEHEGKMIFASARKGGVVLDPEKQDSEYLLDLYWTEQIDDSTWSPATNFGRPLNSSRHEASGCFNNGNTIFYTRWSDQNRDKKHIYLARMVALKFFEALKLDTAVNLDGYQSINPFVTIDGKWLYFSSDRPGGYGGLDIWRVEIDDAGNPISAPENLGQGVNSDADEITPFFHQTTGTLFFSSNGQKSIGGYDCFKSLYNWDGESFGPAKNLGQPINSSYDDSYLIWDKFLRTGWLSSDREPCDSSHCYDIYQVDNGPIKISIEGIVFDNDTQEPIPNATITVKDIEYNFDPFTIVTDEDGFYARDLDQNIEIFMKATKPKYFADAASVSTKQITESTVITQDFFLNPIPEEAIAIEGIEYDFDKATLRPKSKEVLDELAEFLELNDNLTIEIQSHTDIRGNDAYNMDLSRRRAQSVVDYLISKGIPKERLIAKGYGETEPAPILDENKKVVKDENGETLYYTEAYINSLKTTKEKEEAHQRNRRTAFKVLSEDGTVKVESPNQ
jgi:outer membrane protein OmpA-like peptidoglycan-associated protein